MTEEDWLKASDPKPMLELVGKVKPNPRKLRFFACACCRTLWDDAWPQRSRDVILAAEQFADGIISEKQLNNSRSLACQTAQNAIVLRTRQRVEHSDGWVLSSRLTFAADAALANHHIAFRMTVTLPTNFIREDKKLEEVIPSILRDIFGNPFRPVTVHPSWLTPTVVRLAEHIYQERAFDQMPILADALQDADCDNADILNHCRQSSEHVRGCWVLDLLLVKG